MKTLFITVVLLWGFESNAQSIIIANKTDCDLQYILPGYYAKPVKYAFSYYDVIKRNSVTKWSSVDSVKWVGMKESDRKPERWGGFILPETRCVGDITTIKHNRDFNIVKIPKCAKNVSVEWENKGNNTIVVVIESTAIPAKETYIENSARQ